MAVRQRLGETLVGKGLVTRAQVDEALSVQMSTRQKLGEILVSLGYCSDRALLEALCINASIPFLSDAEVQPEPSAVALVPRELAKQYAAIPIRSESRHLIIAMADPFDLPAIRSLSRAAGCSVRVVAAPRDVIYSSIESAYGRAAGVDAAAAPLAVAVGGAPKAVAAAAPAPRLELSRAEPSEPRSFGRAGSVWVPGKVIPSTTTEEGTAAALVDDIIRRGVDMSATDIHIEPLDDVIRVRYRVDGLLADGPSFPKTAQAALVSRIKILATLDIADSRLPQDGRVRLRFNARNVDLRVSTFPTLHGEDVVLRILDRGRVALHLDRLGIEPEDLAILRDALKRPHGLIPVTGPTGSGKTTTLYAALSELNTGSRAIITLEDPIEYEISSIRQSQVNVRAGLTFASGLRSILRHDPDVILVGEMRDQETMQIGLSSALTGHLVLTTLHTTTAAGTIPRLLDMGAEPFVVASAVTLFVSQRLVRILCSQCKTAVDVATPVRQRYGLADVTLYGPRGCAACRASGYRGRTAIYELLPMTEDVIAAIHARTPPDEIQRHSGRPTLLHDGMRKVRAGITALDEILRVTA